MFVTPAVRLPCHGGGSGSGHDGGRRNSYGANKRPPLAGETYLAAGSCSCDGQHDSGHFGTEATRSRSWSGVLPFPSSEKFQPLEIYYLHPHWRSIMGEEAWYQSISDFEEGNYFNSPHLQHGRHGHAVAMEEEESMNDIINMSAYMTNAKSATEAYHLHDDTYFTSDPMMQSSPHPHDQMSTAWPMFSQDAAHEVGREMFANIDINRDLEHLVQGPMTDLGVMSAGSSPHAQEGALQPPAAIMLHSHHFPSPAASPMTSTASQEEDRASAYSPNVSEQGHSAYGLYLMGEQTPAHQPQLRGSSWASSPLRHDRSSHQHHQYHHHHNYGNHPHHSHHHHQSLKRVRKSLPGSPMRNHASARSASFGDSMSPSSTASPMRSRSPGAKEQQQHVLRTGSPSSSSSPMYSSGERASKDEFLVKSRRAGMTYRDIKQQGGFAEAESTLRGRYRMLTKSREERVRNPKWTPVDVVLLRKAVLKFCNGKDPVLVKVPWKEVARFIFDNGGTYLFGNATCRKKWDELASFGMDQEIEDDEEMCVDGTQDCEGEEELEEDEDEDNDEEEAVQ